MKNFNIYAMFSENNNVFSYYTAFSTEKVKLFGIQIVLKKLLTYLDEYFFNVDIEVFLKDYRTYIESNNLPDLQNEVREIYNQGYVGFVLKSLNEGSVVNKGMPLFTMFNNINGSNQIVIDYIANWFANEINNYSYFATKNIISTNEYSLPTAVYLKQTGYNLYQNDILKYYYEKLENVSILPTDDFLPKKVIDLQLTYSYNNEETYENLVPGDKGMVTVDYKNQSFEYVNMFNMEQAGDLQLVSNHGKIEKFVTTFDL